MNPRLITLVALVAAVLVQTGCGALYKRWDQEDIIARDLHDPSWEKKVLVASRKSEFKEKLIEEIEKAFSNDEVYIKVIGVEDLDEEDGQDFNAVVLINTCMWWIMDPAVKEFLRRHENTDHMIVLTTAGGAKYRPKMKGADFDTISSASKRSDVDVLAGEVVEKIRILLQ